MSRIVCVTPLAAALLACSSTTPCKTVRDCTNSQLCVNGGCSELSAAGSALGDPCRTASDCKSGLICFGAAQGFPGGYCTAGCAASPADCTTGACVDIAGSPLCAPQCTSDSTCRQDYGCCGQLGNVCVPVGACPPGACQLPVVQSSLPTRSAADTTALAGPVSIPLGSNVVVDTALSFSVPDGTGSVSIVHQARIANLEVVFNGQVVDNSAVPLKVFFPDGGIAYDDVPSTPISSSPDGGADYSGTYAFFSNYAPSTAVFTFPNTTSSLNAGVPSGTWSFKVNDFANECAKYVTGCSDGGSTTNTYDVGVLLRPGSGSTLNTDFYIVADLTTRSGQLLTAQNAQTDPSVQRFVQTYQGILAAHGMTVNVRFWDVDAVSRSLYGTSIVATNTGPCDPLDQMFLLSAAHPGNTANIFLVQSMRSSSTSGGNTIVGIDGTIPGPSSLNGTVHSGAVVAAADMFTQSTGSACSGLVNLAQCGADRVAYIAAHETGHYLGLFHTTEQNGGDFDTLSDTGKCPCIPCSGASVTSCTGSNPPLVNASQCVSATCQGGDNLMFWLLDAFVSQGKLSAQQDQVMRLNPAVQ